MTETMSWRIPKIYPLTNVDLAGMSHADQVQRLIEGGASLIQLREKNLPLRKFHEEAKAALAVARAHGAILIINDRVDLALALNADGVHLGQDDLPPELARKLLGPDALIGFSTHSVEQAEIAAELPIDYIAIGPIFHTTSKEDTAPIVGLEGIRAVRRVAPDVPIVAIGGLIQDRIPQVLAAGADSIAVMSAVLAGPQDISTTVDSLLQTAG